MNSQTMVVKALSEHIIMVILYFRVKMWCMNKNNFIFQSYRSIKETTVKFIENIL